METKTQSNKGASSPTAFWSLTADAVLKDVDSQPTGLTTAQAQQRLNRNKRKSAGAGERVEAVELFLAQFSSPIILMLLFTAVLSFLLNERVDSLVILSIVFISGALGFWQEYGARDAIAKMLAIVQTKTLVLRNGAKVEVPSLEVVPGDIVCLSAGATVSGDCLMLQCNNLFMDEAALTGETFPVEKRPGVLPADQPLSERNNTLYMGTHVVSGTGEALVVGTGDDTEFGKVSQRLRLKPPETDFERGIRRFGYFLMEVTMVLVVIIFGTNVFLGRPVLQSFMFSLALAVGLTPQLLPAIISINLAGGAKRMAAAKVIVKRLSSIESFGSMNVLCSDKTGTITEGKVQLQAATDVNGNNSEHVFLLAYINSVMETGFVNPVDEAIRAHKTIDLSSYSKVDELPYDFVRKRLSILVQKGDERTLITKGALENVLDVCTQSDRDGVVSNIESVRYKVLELMQQYSHDGFRVLGVACKQIGGETKICADSEEAMILVGLLIFADPPKEGIADTIKELNGLGIALKIITGDNRWVAATVGKQVGFAQPRVLAADELSTLSDAALLGKVNDTDIFAGVEPNQKERIIIALKKAGNVVGYIGDGINDASALHAADVGISVNNAVDVAKEAAQLVMLDHDLKVLVEGVREGRRTFANTMKYIFMATSANFGNMFSMAGASLFLPFLPLLPKQILLTNLMSDCPEMTIVTDRVDQELVQAPGRWNIGFIRKFMLVFGTLSSLFDIATFAILILILHATPNLFRTGWFVESVVSSALIVLVIRTRRPFNASLPSKALVLATIAVVALAVLLPFTPLSQFFDFQPLPLQFLAMLAVIVVVYIVSAELAKKWFYARLKGP